LDRSILAKAFWGEVVEQDPNDEPATVLLDCIRTEREQQAQGKEGRAKLRQNRRNAVPLSNMTELLFNANQLI